MKKFLYVSFDSCAGMYSFFGEFVNDAVATRHFNSLVKDTPVPSDFCLYRTGSYLTETGVIDAEHDVVFICRGEKVM
uniref:Nonstructural protein n=1 Tax=Dulem virus 169 TaxID=3145646 RepID=A0AAU8B851_9VIRU